MKRLSQSPGLDTLPTASGGGASGGEGGENATQQSTYNVIYSPLDSLGKILADLDFKTFLENNFGDDPETLAHKIWVMYGGSENELRPGKKGARQDKPQSSDITQQSAAQEQEYNATRNKRWRRLPVGVSIDEITNTQAIKRAIVGGFAALAKGFVKPASASKLQIIKIADIADEKGYFSYADKLDNILRHVYTS